MTTTAIINTLKQRQNSVVCAESLTGGLLCSAFVRVPGASGVFLGGFICYTDDMKSNQLNVPSAILTHYSAVSPQAARHMAEGALQKTTADYAIATTGYAGPSGNPPGLCYIAIASRLRTAVFHLHVTGCRNAVRKAVVQIALNRFYQQLKG